MDQKTPEGDPMASSEPPAESPPSMPAETPPAIPAEAVPAPATAAPPPVGWNAAIPARAPGGSVTGLAKIAAGILIVVGLFITLAGLVLVGGGALIGSAGQSDFPGLAGPLGALAAGFLAGIGAVVIVLGVVGFLAGIGSWRGSGAGRVVGIIYGVLGALSGVSGLSSSDSGGSLGSVIVLVLFGYVAVVLLFRWKAPATA